MIGPIVTPELAAAANCAGAFLLFVAFFLIACLAVALYFAWRWLVVSQRSAPEAMALVAAQLERIESGTTESATALVRPQVRLASNLAGLRAGLQALVRPARRAEASPPPGPPEQVTPEPPAAESPVGPEGLG